MTQAQRSVLVVEDSTLVADALRILLEDAGYVVSIAPTVEDAVNTASATQIDMMLLDLSLPDGDGLDVLRQLRGQLSAPSATIAMTGHNDAGIRRACLEAGCVDMLVKPVPIAEILRQIERHLV